MQQFLPEGQGERVRIAVDHREDEIFDKLFKSYGADVDRRSLSVGDFLCSARLAIERKTRSDFEASIMDGRLFTQLPSLVSNYERVVILVEGVEEEGRLGRPSLLGAYASIIADYGASLVFTRDQEETAELVFGIAKHEQLAKGHAMRIYAKKRTLTPSQASRSIVESLPMVGPKTAKAILNHFGSVEALVRATEREMAGVPGVGKKRAKMMKDILSYIYKEDEDRQSY